MPPGLTSSTFRYRLGKCESQSTRLTQLSAVPVPPPQAFLVYQLITTSRLPSYVPGTAPEESRVVVTPCGKLRHVVLSPLSNRKPSTKPGRARVAGSVIGERPWFASSMTSLTLRRTIPARLGSAAISES